VGGKDVITIIEETKRNLTQMIKILAFHAECIPGWHCNCLATAAEIWGTLINCLTTRGMNKQQLSWPRSRFDGEIGCNDQTKAYGDYQETQPCERMGFFQKRSVGLTPLKLPLKA
jgi:hypothetical protein